MSFSDLSAVVVLASEGGGGEPNPLYWANDLAFFTLIIFVGLMLVLAKFAWKPIIAGLNERERSIADNIDSAESANEKAQAQLKAYDEKLAGASSEAAALIAEARADATVAKEKILAEAASEAQRTKEQALAAIEAAKNAAVQGLAESSVDSAVSLAGNIVGRSLNKDDHSKLIKEAVERFKSGSSA